MGAIAIIPSTPLLVPELAGAAAAEVADLRAAVLTVAASLPARWVVVGVGGADGVLGPACAGTFAGFGVDLPVGFAPATGSSQPAVELPVCALVAGWVRGQAQPAARVHVRVYSADHDRAEALACGRTLRAELDQTPDPTGVLVVADGLNTLTPAAPGGDYPDDAEVQLDLDDALAGGDVTALTQLPRRVPGWVGWQVLAGLVEPAPRSAHQLYRGAPYGVGYFVGVWQP